MNIRTGIKKLKKLSVPDLNHMIQLCEIDIKNYEIIIENYPPDRIEKYGQPYLKILKQNKSTFENQLKIKKTELGIELGIELEPDNNYEEECLKHIAGKQLSAKYENDWDRTGSVKIEFKSHPWDK